jgi:hypothetical protein
MVAVEAWEMMEEHNCLPPNPKLINCLWALTFMKLYPANDKALSSMLGGDPKTIRKYTWLFINLIFESDGVVMSLLLQLVCLINNTLTFFFLHKIQFENRKRGDVGNDSLLSVDGTDFCVTKSYKKPFYSYKFKKSGFRYELALCIKTRNICWWAGLHLPGIWNDTMIFQDGLVNYLEVGERCKTDDGYRGSAPLNAKSPRVIEANLGKAEIQQKVRNGQETVNSVQKLGYIINPLPPQVAGAPDSFWCDCCPYSAVFSG